jgi:dihydroxyacetone kinase
MKNSLGINVPVNIIVEISEHENYLSELDSLGDGDHGINMTKGMKMALKNIQDNHIESMTGGFEAIKSALMEHVGGSMGPLYGMIFRGFIAGTKNEDEIDGAVVSKMLKQAMINIEAITPARLGDKSLLDVLIPAQKAYEKEYELTHNLNLSLKTMASASMNGLESTRNMKSGIGRSARLGDKTIGHLDAGAASCNIILNAFIDAMLGNERGEWHATLPK